MAQKQQSNVMSTQYVTNILIGNGIGNRWNIFSSYAKMFASYSFKACKLTS